MVKTRTFLVLIVILLSCSKCSENEEKDYTNNHPELLATWQYVEFLGIDVSCLDCGPYIITDGFTITFNANGTFTSNELPEYPTGNYVVSSSNQITLTYKSATLKPIINVKEILNISGKGLILNPIPICYEGCGERYEKVITP